MGRFLLHSVLLALLTASLWISPARAQGTIRASDLPRIPYYAVLRGRPFGSTAGVTYGEFTWWGPKPGVQIPLFAGFDEIVGNGDRSRLFALAGGVFEVDLAAQTARALPLPAELPMFSFPKGIAYDSARDRLLVSSLGGEGLLYAFDLQDEQWSVLGSLNNVDLTGITYDPATDRLYGLGTTPSQPPTSYGLYEYDADGNQIGAREIGLPQLEPFPAYRWTQIATVGDYLAFIQSPEPFVPTIFAIDPRSGQYWRVLVPEPSTFALAAYGVAAGIPWTVRRLRPRR